MPYTLMKQTIVITVLRSAMQEKQTSINRKVQSVSADATQIAQLQKDKQTLEDKLQEHKDMACESPQYYKEMKQKCCEQWKEMAHGESNG